jgi:hypothetical protein
MEFTPTVKPAVQFQDEEKNWVEMKNEISWLKEVGQPAKHDEEEGNPLAIH